MDNTKTILITGANGQLGQAFREIAEVNIKYSFIFTDKSALDITNQNAVNNFFAANNIDVCINCAAYTAVDKAETEKEIAITVNTTAVGFLAEACKNTHTQFIHISTDYVFDGTATQPYQPTNATNPINFYGLTKLNGELLAIKENPQTIIIRTAWVYSQFGNNFVKTMLRLMAQKHSINVVNDQYGAPTNAADLVEAIMCIINTNNFVAGIYHYTNIGNITWFEFAKEIANNLKTTCIVQPIPSAQFKTAAARPMFSNLDTSKILKVYKVHMYDWKLSLQKCIAKIQ